MNLVVPYNTQLSKNKKYIGACRGRLVMSPTYKMAKQDLILTLQMAYEKTNEVFVPKKKIYIGAFFYRPDMRSDIQNFQEAFCDCIASVIKVNDNYFAFKEWDYCLDKNNPRIFLEITQG